MKNVTYQVELRWCDREKKNHQLEKKETTISDLLLLFSGQASTFLFTISDTHNWGEREMQTRCLQNKSCETKEMTSFALLSCANSPAFFFHCCPGKKENTTAFFSANIPTLHGRRTLHVLTDLVESLGTPTPSANRLTKEFLKKNHPQPPTPTPQRYHYVTDNILYYVYYAFYTTTYTYACIQRRFF